MKKIWILPLFFFAGCVSSNAVSPKTSLPNPTPQTPAAAVPAAAPETKGNVVKIKIETTEGNILAELYPDKAPKAVENFVKLTNQGFYNGIIFHRVIPKFMIQTGDPTGTGRGGPGYQFDNEYSDLHYDRPGRFGMANAGPNTNGSQFFITENEQPHLDGGYTIFGQVTDGMDVVHKIASAQRDANDKPLQDIKMTKVTIL